MERTVPVLGSDRQQQVLKNCHASKDVLKGDLQARELGLLE